jgi:hypothetical protein
LVVARFEVDWQYLSREHERIAIKIKEILDKYASDQLNHFAYTVIGTFGAGKTQLLFQIFKWARDKGLLPLYFVAEDLFREVIGSEKSTYTPGSIFTLIEEKIKNLKKALSENNGHRVREILDPRGKLESDAPEIANTIVREFSKSDVENIKVVLLVDELEGQYGILQDKVMTTDRSPLRDWLENRNHLKFLAFAPAGIYELGGADRDRVIRIVLPPVEIGYVRKNLINDAGRSNACWWLSRGKARQLFKAYEVLKKKGDSIETTEAFRIIHMELDSIGQEPTKVPPAVTEAVNPSKISSLLNLCPIVGERAKRYVIDTNKLDTGELANKLVEAFNLGRDNAVLIADYFKRTVQTLSDDESIAYIQDRELPELFRLTLDHLLEYEHGSPELSGTMGEILNLYEKVLKESASLYGIIGTLWELKETTRQLPLTIEEIRNAFPFPTMNPQVKNYIPREMKRKWEGKGVPIWKWLEGDIAIFFFASERDFLDYSEKDEFLSSTISDGKGVLCLFPADESLKGTKPLLTWLEKNGKFKFLELPGLITDFLLSASGEIRGDIPQDLHLFLKNFKESKEDPLLSRKSEIYGEAISEMIRDSLPKPRTYYKGVPPDAGDVWGKTKIQDRYPVVVGLALAFENLKPEERKLLADLRELFKGGKEGKGVGDLREFLPRGGLPTLVDDLLPRYGIKKELKDSETILRLSAYWRDEEKNELIELARILPLHHFLKLHSDEDMNRLLEALWRTVRKEFDLSEIDTLITTFEEKVLPVLNKCHELEREGISNFGLSGIDFENNEVLVKAKDGFEKLVEIAKRSIDDDGDAAPILKSIVRTIMGSLSVKDNIVRTLEGLCISAKNALDKLEEAGENLKRNYWEYRKATKFAELTEEHINKLVSEYTKINGKPSLQTLENKAREAKDYLDSITNTLRLLEEMLGKIDQAFKQITEVY